ncbi:MAG: glycosyltransferase [Metamycoplasmataceae bacterium]
MKKVLIISGNNHHFTSGADMYTKRIIDILKKQDCIIDEYSFQVNMTQKDLEATDDINIITPGGKFNDCKKFRFKWMLRSYYNIAVRSRRKLDKLVDNYDLVIDASLTLVRSKKILNSDKYLYIQHQSADFFEMKRYGIVTPIAYLLIRAFGFKDCFKFAKNIVFFDESNKKYIEDKFKQKTNTKYFWVYNTSIKREVIEENKRLKDEIYKNNTFERNITYIGRVTAEQKRLNDVDKMLKKTKNKLDVYGFGSYENKIKKNKNVIFHGRVDNEKVININLHSKFNFLLSNYEGFPGSLVESICSMTPIIARDSFISAKFLTDNNKNGFLLDYKKNIDKYAQQFDNINDLPIEKVQELSENCYQFAIKYLCYEDFEKKWIAIYKEMVKEV